MSEEETQPIDRRIIAAAQRAIAREEARRQAEAQANNETGASSQLQSAQPASEGSTQRAADASAATSREAAHQEALRQWRAQEDARRQAAVRGDASQDPDANEPLTRSLRQAQEEAQRRAQEQEEARLDRERAMRERQEEAEAASKAAAEASMQAARAQAAKNQAAREQAMQSQSKYQSSQQGAYQPPAESTPISYREIRKPLVRDDGEGQNEIQEEDATSAAPSDMTSDASTCDGKVPDGVLIEANDTDASQQQSAEEIISLSPEEEISKYLDAFFIELARCGVRDAVVSPGIHSMPLILKANEHIESVHVVVDERSAAFFALGLARATGNPVVSICAGGMVAANWLPAIMEAQQARVPLLMLTAGVFSPSPLFEPAGSDATAGFLDASVKLHITMPAPAADEESLAFARQAALDGCIAAHGALPGAASCDGGPVHIGFSFQKDSRVVPCTDFESPRTLPPTVVPGQGLLPRDAMGLFHVLKGKRAVALCGEGTCVEEADARIMLEFAHKRNIPILADPLSGLRNYDDSLVIDCYDTVFAHDEVPAVDVVVRFGRWPQSPWLRRGISDYGATQIVVDMRDTRDDLNSTDLFVRCAPVVFAQAMIDVHAPGTASATCAKEWTVANDEASMKIGAVRTDRNMDAFEGAYVDEMLDSIPEGSLLYCGSGLSARVLETFYCRRAKDLTVLGSGHLQGIDGALSMAMGAAQAFGQTTILLGDIAFLRDSTALALQGEMSLHADVFAEKRGASGEEYRGRYAGSEGHGSESSAQPSIVIVLLNNNGEGLHDLPERFVDERTYERLFIAPQDVDFKHLAAAYDVSCRRVSTVHDFRRAYNAFLGRPGISLIDVPLPLVGVADRFEPYC